MGAYRQRNKLKVDLSKVYLTTQEAAQVFGRSPEWLLRRNKKSVGPFPINPGSRPQLYRTDEVCGMRSKRPAQVEVS